MDLDIFSDICGVDALLVIFVISSFNGGGRPQSESEQNHYPSGCNWQTVSCKVFGVNGSMLYQEQPFFTSCLLDTIPVWLSCGYLWLAAVPHLIYILRTKHKPLPFSYKHIIKTALCMAVMCLGELHLSFRQMYGSRCGGLELATPAAQMAMWIKVASFLLAAAIIQVQKRCGVVTSGVMFIFWTMLVSTETLTLYSYITDDKRCLTQVVYYIYFGTVCLQLLAHCWAEKREYSTKEKSPCPHDHASILNRLTFHWLSMLVYSVYRNKFTRDSMWRQTSSIRSADVGAILQRNWDLEVAKMNKYRDQSMFMSNNNEKVPPDHFVSIGSETTPLLSKDEKSCSKKREKMWQGNLFHVVMKTYWTDIFIFCATSLIAASCFFTEPMILGLLIDFIDTKGINSTPKWIGVFYALLLFIVIEICSLSYHTVIHYTAASGLRIKSALMFLIYKKALTVSKSENTTSVGEIVNLMSVDCQRIQDCVTFSYYIFVGPFFIIVATWLLWTIAGGPATIASMFVLLLIFPINMYIARLQNTLQKELLHLKSLRVKLMNEILSGIKVLKMYAWERTFIAKIDSIREREVARLRQNAILMAVTTAIANQSLYMIHFVLIAVYVAVTSNHYISSSIVFVSLSIIVVVKYPLVMMPTVINSVVQIIVLEASNRLGGWMQTLSTKEGAFYEMGPRSIRPIGESGHNTLVLAEEIGLSDEVLGVPRGHAASKNRYIYANNQLNALPSSFLSLFRRNPPFSKSIMAYAANDFLHTGGNMEDESVHSFISRRFGADIANYAIDPLCRGIFAGDCRDLSVKSCFPPLFAAEQNYGSVVRGMAAGVIKNKDKKTLKECKLAAQAKSEQWASYSFNKGTQQLVDRLTEVISLKPEVEIVKNAACSEIEIGDGEMIVTVNGEKIKTDRVISSIYAQDLAKLLPKELKSLSTDLNKIPAVTAVVVGIELDGLHLPSKQGFGHLLPSSEDGKVLGVIYDSCTFPLHDRKDRPSTRYTVMMGGSWFANLESDFPSMDKDELGRFATEALVRQLGLSADVQPIRTEVAILKDCIPQYVVGHSKVIDSIFSVIKQQRLPLSVVGSSYKGPSVNDCINNTRLEVEKITGTQLQ